MPIAIQLVEIDGLLSFRGLRVELGSLNVLIGVNGAGKSNFLSCLSILHGCPSDAAKVFRDSGIDTWLRVDSQEALLDAVVDGPIRHRLIIGADQRRPLFRERLFLSPDVVDEKVLFASEPASARLRARAEQTRSNIPNLIDLIAGLDVEVPSFDRRQSVLSQIREPSRYPEIGQLADLYSRMSFHRSFDFGARNLARRPQPTDLSNEVLLETEENLAMVVQRLLGAPRAKKRFLENLRRLYSGIDDIHVELFGNAAQVVMFEGERRIPSGRLSDGTLRYIGLLCILCDPDPPPFIAIEEPELGLHPDLIPTISELLQEASERTQLVVTTHSERLVDTLGDKPETVLVCEKDPEEGTTIERLDAADLKEWLEKYSLGKLWNMGHLGGTRW